MRRLPSPDASPAVNPRSGEATGRHAAKKVTISAHNLRAIFDNDKLSILIYRERDGVVVEANAGAATLFRADRNTLVGLPVELLLGRPAGDKHAGERDDRLIGTPDGGVRTVECHRSRLPGTGEPLAFAHLVDVTEHRRTEALFQQAQKMEVVGRLAGGIAHDFNNLITIIGGYAEMLQEKLADGDPRRGDAEEIMRATRRAADLTRQLLTMSRRGESDPRPLDVNGRLRETLRLLARLLGEDIRLEFTEGAGLPEVLLDAGQFEQAVLNLAVNARDAMPDGGTLTLRTDAVDLAPDDPRLGDGIAPGRFVRVQVRDTGCGIPREHLAHLFEPFFTTKRSGEGTGLGLSLVYGIVRRHGGFVQVYSETGRGTLFALHFPALSADATGAEPAGGTGAPPPADGRGPDKPGSNPAGPVTARILLVEDDDTVRAFAEAALVRQGHSVVPVGSAEEALRRFPLERFDLVVSDVVLAGESGVALAERLLALSPGTPLLLTSGYPDSRAQWEEIVGRGYRFLQKPYTMKRLAVEVRETLAAASGDSHPVATAGGCAA